ncbi:MAG: hypothetical protein WCO57_00265 [Verrucomicrobiota bacterium]
MHCTRRFFIALPLGFLVMLGLYMFAVRLQLGSPTAMSHWCSEINRKKLDAATQISSPKIVLLGGSATLFGIKASLLEQELGVPTLNAATHAALGMAYLLENGKHALRPGDTVILVPEFEILDYGEAKRSVWASSMYVDYILARDPDYYRKLSLSDQIEIALMMPLKRLVTGLAGRDKPEPTIRYAAYDAYDPARVDAHGDMTGHTAQRRPAACPPRDERVCEPLVSGLPANASGLPLLVGFCRWATENRIRVLAGFPNTADQPCYDTPCAIALETRLREFFAAQGVPLIGSLHDALMPPAEFFDSNYHPTEEASVQRTIRLAAQLKPWFAASGKSSPPR